MLSPVSPVSPMEVSGLFQRNTKREAHFQRELREVKTSHHRQQIDPPELLHQMSRDSQDSSYNNSSRETTPRDVEERWELREIIRKDRMGSGERKGSCDELEFIHERESSVSSTYSQSSQRSSNTLPHQKKSSSTSSDHRYTVRIFY